jgi:hypothetical protein
MDRYKTNIATSQLSFIDTFVMPSFETLMILLPKMQINLDLLIDNREKWNGMKDHYDKILKSYENNNNQVKKVEKV